MGAGIGPQRPTSYTQNRGDAPPARRRHPVDQRRHAAPVDHPRRARTPPTRRASAQQNVPDMPDPGPGAMTFYYTNQQSARLMFYHDHAYGITRLNVYAGEAAGYLITRPSRGGPDRPAGVIAGDLAPARLPLRDPAHHPGQDLRARPRPRWPPQDPTWDTCQLGRLRQPLVPARLHAQPEPRATSPAPTPWAAGTTVPGSGRPVHRPAAWPDPRRSGVPRPGVPGTPTLPWSPKPSWTPRWSTAPPIPT